MTPSRQVDEIAASLTKAQRQIMATAPIDGEWFPVFWEGWKAVFGRNLQSIGLAYPREAGMQRLSPLGLAVRTAILDQEKGK